MKKVLFATLCMVAGLSAYAQGSVNFANIGGGVNAPVTNADNGDLLGAGFMAQLQLADGTDVGAPADFALNGLFSGGTRTIDGVAGGGMATLQVFVSSEDGMITGTSNQFTVTLGGSGTPPAPPAALTGLEAFSVTVIPEPSTIALAILGGAALFLRRRK